MVRSRTLLAVVLGLGMAGAMASPGFAQGRAAAPVVVVLADSVGIRSRWASVWNSG